MARPHKQDTSAAHGEPLGEEEIKLTKRNYGWPEDAKFLVPDGVYEHFDELMGKRGHESARGLDGEVRASTSREFPELADQLFKMQHRQLPDGWDRDIPVFPAGCEGHGRTRCFRQRCRTRSRKRVPWLIGGSADLAPSTKTRLTFEGAGDFDGDELRRPQFPLRHSRARHGLDPEWHVAVEDPALRLGLPDLQRLHARGPSA